MHLVGLGGLEPPASCLSGCRCSRLSEGLAALKWYRNDAAGALTSPARYPWVLAIARRWPWLMAREWHGDLVRAGLSAARLTRRARLANGASGDHVIPAAPERNSPTTQTANEARSDRDHALPARGCPAATRPRHTACRGSGERSHEDQGRPVRGQLRRFPHPLRSGNRAASCAAASARTAANLSSTTIDHAARSASAYLRYRGSVSRE
jgi:hypothetical protein